MVAGEGARGIGLDWGLSGEDTAGECLEEALRLEVERVEGMVMVVVVVLLVCMETAELLIKKVEEEGNLCDPLRTDSSHVHTYRPP